MPLTISKANATQWLLNVHSNATFSLAIGESRWDEEMFMVLDNEVTKEESALNCAITCTTNTRSSQAHWFLPGVAGVLRHLEETINSNK